MSSRKGKMFEMGYPYLSGSSTDLGRDQGVVYMFPERSFRDNSYEKSFRDKKEGLANHLVGKLSEYMEEFNISGGHTSIQYSGTREGFVLHMMNGGRWIEVCPEIDGFLNFHYLDGFSQAIVGFNIGSDTLEYLDESILCPRISKREDGYKIIYPTPDGEGLSNKAINKLSDEKIFKRIFELVKLDKPKLTNPFGYNFKEGNINAQDSYIEGNVTNGWDVSKTSFVMAKMLDCHRFSKEED